MLPLAVYFLAQNDSRMRFSESAAKLLLAYAWPGNIRELRNVVTKAAVMARSLEIRPDDLASLHSSTPPDIWQRSRSPGTATNLGLVERRTILEALSATGGHQQKAAERLGISRRTLSRKLKLYESARLEAAS